MKPDAYDSIQDLARSAFADMLHDVDRNEKYEAAIKSAVEETKSRGLEPRVLDIGTGTGLLSMLACRHGAEDVIACEAFSPVAKIARRIVDDNGFGERIKIVRKRSTDMSLERDMDGRRANILVTEVFDTELIGEGAIETFRHALDHLLTSDCIVVPSLARVFVQVVNSESLWRWHKLQSFSVNDKLVEIPPNDTFPCGDVFYDLQLSQLPLSEFSLLSAPIKIFEFDFSGATRLLDSRSVAVDFAPSDNGVAHALFFWWDLRMDLRGDVWIDMKPGNLSTDKDVDASHPWRDHWMQAVYFLSDERRLIADRSATLIAAHDSYSFSFRMKDDESIAPSLSPAIVSRSRLGWANCPATREKLLASLRRVVGEDSVVCCVGEGSLLPLLAASLGAKRVFLIDNHRWTRDLTESLARHNGFSDCVRVVTTPFEKLCSDDFDGLKIDVLVSDMHFRTTCLPWDSLYFSYVLRGLRHALKKDFVCLPREGVLRGICVEMKDLWKIRAPVGKSALGFDLSEFDAAVISASAAVDPVVEPQPLWEYPCRAVSAPADLMTFDLQTLAIDAKLRRRETILEVRDPAALNGVAFWMEWRYDDDVAVLTGMESIDPNGSIRWNRNWKQGIFVRNRKGAPESISVKVNFEPSNADVTFRIQ